MMKNNIQSVPAAENPPLATADIVHDALDCITLDIRSAIEDSCLSLCHEFSLIESAIGSLDDKEAARGACQRAMIALQFQDRHNQAMQDMSRLLQYIRDVNSGAAPIAVEDLCTHLQLEESRNHLRRKVGQEIKVTDTVELF